MASLKIAREAGQHDPDNVDDAMGYLHMVPEVRKWMAARGADRVGTVLDEGYVGQTATIRRQGDVTVGREMDQMRGDPVSRQGIIRE